MFTIAKKNKTPEDLFKEEIRKSRKNNGKNLNENKTISSPEGIGDSIPLGLLLKQTDGGKAIERIRTWAMRNKKTIAIAIAIVLAIFAGKELYKNLSKPDIANGPLIPTVGIVEIQERTLRREIKAPGTVTFLEKAAVTSKVQGRMAQLFVDIGDKVKAGDRLGALETFEIELKLKQTEASVQSALSQLRLAESRYKNARRDVDRQINGIERAQSDILAAKATFLSARQNLQNKRELYDIGGISENQLKTTYTEYLNAMTRYYQTRKTYAAQLIGYRDQDLADDEIPLPTSAVEKKKAFVDFNTEVDRRQVEVARAAYQSALAELESMQLILRESTIVAPLDGVVASRAIEVGEEIKQGEPVFTIVRMDELLVTSGIPEDVLHQVEIGQKVRVSVDAHEGKDFEGAVYKISPVIDIKTRSGEVKIEITNIDTILNPGMFCRISIETGLKENAIAVPVSSVINRVYDDIGQQYGEVFVLQGNMAFKKKVVLGETYGEDIEIVSGLSPGDEVITDKADSLKDGSQVNPDRKQKKEQASEA